MKNIRAQHLKEKQKQENVYLLDVRSGDEYALARIAGACCIPLDHLANRMSEIPKDREVLVYCGSGNRSRRAIEFLKGHGFENLVQLEGGLQEFEKAGGTVLRQGHGLSIMQQVQVTAGFLVLVGFLLAWLVHPWFALFSAFVGAGLIFAGLSGYCGMAQLLSKMPWNRRLTQALQGEVC